MPQSAQRTTLVHHVCIQHAVLLEVMRDSVLGQQRVLQLDFSADPFALGVGHVGCMVAHLATEALPECGTLDLSDMPEALPGCVADRATDVNLESYS